MVSYILHIETATDVCSVSLASSGVFKREHHTAEARQHISSLSILIDEILAQEQITYKHLVAVAVSTGPGSYTGLRVGYATAKGLALGLDIPLIEVDTLYSIAWGMKQAGTHEATLCVPMIDARRMEVYSALYDENLYELQAAAPWILDEKSIQDLCKTYDSIAFGGNGAFKVEEFSLELSTHKILVMKDLECNSAFLIESAWQKFNDQKWSDMAYCEPKYIKPPNITKPRTKQ